VTGAEAAAVIATLSGVPHEHKLVKEGYIAAEPELIYNVEALVALSQLGIARDLSRPAAVEVFRDRLRRIAHR